MLYPSLNTLVFKIPSSEHPALISESADSKPSFCGLYSKLIGYDDVKVRFGAIGCVSRSAGLVFCDVIIETNGGRTIRAKGFTRSDAEEIVDLLS